MVAFKLRLWQASDPCSHFAETQRLRVLLGDCLRHVRSILCVAKPGIVGLGPKCANHQHFPSPILLYSYPFGLSQQARPIASVLEGPFRPISHGYCRSKNMQLSDDCGFLPSNFGPMGGLARYSQSEIPDENILSGVFVGEEDFRSSRSFVNNRVESNLVRVRSGLIP